MHVRSTDLLVFLNCAGPDIGSMFTSTPQQPEHSENLEVELVPHHRDSNYHLPHLSRLSLRPDIATPGQLGARSRDEALGYKIYHHIWMGGKL